jgi:hypothetical protein
MPIDIGIEQFVVINDSVKCFYYFILTVVRVILRPLHFKYSLVMCNFNILSRELLHKFLALICDWTLTVL